MTETTTEPQHPDAISPRSLPEIGTIEREGAVLKLTYRTFGQDRVAYLDAGGLRCIAQDRWTLPVPVYRKREDPRGSGSIENVSRSMEKIGRARRSLSGRWLKVDTVDSDGEIVVCWSAFLLVARGETERAMIRRDEDREARTIEGV